MVAPWLVPKKRTPPPAAGTVVSTYFVSGAPTAGGGVRFFGTNQGATIYQSTAAVPVTQNGAPAGATPIQ